MKIRPNLEEAKTIAADMAYDVLPVSFEMLSDFTTPIEVMKRLKTRSKHCYMLESVGADEKWGRYTFLGFEPKMEITCIEGTITVSMKSGEQQSFAGHPSDYLREVLSQYKSPRFDYLPPFTGGLVGFFSFDYFGYSEPRVRGQVYDSEAFRDVDLMLFDKVIAFDNVRQKIILIANMALDDLEKNYEKAAFELQQIADLLHYGEKNEEPGGKLLEEVTP